MRVHRRGSSLLDSPLARFSFRRLDTPVRFQSVSTRGTALTPARLHALHWPVNRRSGSRLHVHHCSESRLHIDEQSSNTFEAKAAALKGNLQKKLWDPKRQFFFPLARRDEERVGFKVRAGSLTHQTGQFTGSEYGRELIGYVPWQFNLPDPGFEARLRGAYQRISGQLVDGGRWLSYRLAQLWRLRRAGDLDADHAVLSDLAGRLEPHAAPLGQRRAVRRHEGAVRARRALVNRARQQLFAGAGLPQQKHGRL